MATGVTEYIDVTTADVYLEEIWSKKVTVAREQNLVFAKNVDRKFEPELKKGQVLRIGNVSNLAARSKSTNTAITYETVTETEATLTVSSFYYSAIALEDVIKPQISVDLLNKYLPKMGYALALQQDDDIAALIDDGTITQTVGTLATELTYDNLIRADQYLNDASVPNDGRFIVMSPALKGGFLKLDQFINKDYADIRNGIVGSWMNYPIFVTPNVDGTNAAGHDNAMLHTDCIAAVEQQQPTVKTFWDIDYFCVKMASLTAYTQGIIRADHGVWAKGA